MSNATDNFSEQLSAFMDGELPEAEARFLQRRLEHDSELRSKWMRLQVAATCMKGQPWRPMSDTLCTQVDAEIARTGASKVRHPVWRWGMAASVAALAIVFAPRLIQDTTPESATIAVSAGAPATERMLPSPASADLVAMRTADRGTPTPTPAPTVAATAPTTAPDFADAGPETSAEASPLPLSAQSPTDFPLVDSGDKRAWPRSELSGTANDPALEAYLVRHNQMLANDGLGGFVPYVDVVASDQPATPPDDRASGRDGGANEQ